MLRVPDSINHKDQYDLPVVTVVRDSETPIASWPKLTSAIKPKGTKEVAREAADTDKALKRFNAALRAQEPLTSRRMWLRVHVMKKKDQSKADGVNRSRVLRQMILRLKALGLTEGETFALAWRSGWNKFRVDGRSKDDLWHEVDKAYGK
jgi:hypothetical protein